MRETYAPVLLARKTARLRKERNNPDLRSKLDKSIPTSRLITQSIVRPLKLLTLSPIVLLLSLYTSFAFGLTFLLFTTFPSVYGSKYHFSAGVSGLAYLGMGIGSLLGVVTFAFFSDSILKAQAAKDSHRREGEDTREKEGDASNIIKFKPEHRLILMAYATPVLPLGFFWYGWAADKGVHWIVPILGTSLIGVSSLLTPRLRRLLTTF